MAQDGLLMRNCIACGQIDDHPRHVTDVGDFHHDCHARSAFACEVCEAVSAEGLTGDELREHIVANDPGGEVARRINEQHLEDARRAAEQSQEA